MLLCALQVLRTCNTKHSRNERITVNGDLHTYWENLHCALQERKPHPCVNAMQYCLHPTVLVGVQEYRCPATCYLPVSKRRRLSSVVSDMDMLQM